MLESLNNGSKNKIYSNNLYPSLEKITISKNLSQTPPPSYTYAEKKITVIIQYLYILRYFKIFGFKKKIELFFCICI